MGKKLIFVNLYFQKFLPGCLHKHAMMETYVECQTIGLVEDKQAEVTYKMDSIWLQNKN